MGPLGSNQVLMQLQRKDMPFANHQEPHSMIELEHLLIRRFTFLIRTSARCSAWIGTTHLKTMLEDVSASSWVKVSPDAFRRQRNDN